MSISFIERSSCCSNDVCSAVRSSAYHSYDNSDYKAETHSYDIMSSQLYTASLPIQYAATEWYSVGNM